MIELEGSKLSFVLADKPVGFQCWLYIECGMFSVVIQIRRDKEGIVIVIYGIVL